MTVGRVDCGDGSFILGVYWQRSCGYAWRDACERRTGGKEIKKIEATTVAAKIK